MPDQDQINKKERMEGIKKREPRKEETKIIPDNFEKSEKSLLTEKEGGWRNEKKEKKREGSYLESIKEKISRQIGDKERGDEKNKTEEIDIKKQAQEIYNLQDADQQVDKLVQLAIQKDPFQAIKVAQHLDENYVLDKLHDGLLGEEIQKILREKGILR